MFKFIILGLNNVNLLIKLELIKYARCLDSNHPNVQEITPNEALYGGKKTKKTQAAASKPFARKENKKVSIISRERSR